MSQQNLPRFVQLLFFTHPRMCKHSGTKIPQKAWIGHIMRGAYGRSKEK